MWCLHNCRASCLTVLVKYRWFMMITSMIIAFVCIFEYLFKHNISFSSFLLLLLLLLSFFCCCINKTACFSAACRTMFFKCWLFSTFIFNLFHPFTTNTIPIFIWQINVEEEKGRKKKCVFVYLLWFVLLLFFALPFYFFYFFFFTFFFFAFSFSWKINFRANENTLTEALQRKVCVNYGFIKFNMHTCKYLGCVFLLLA